MDPSQINIWAFSRQKLFYTENYRRGANQIKWHKVLTNKQATTKEKKEKNKKNSFRFKQDAEEEKKRSFFSFFFLLFFFLDTLKSPSLTLMCLLSQMHVFSIEPLRF